MSEFPDDLNITVKIQKTETHKGGRVSNTLFVEYDACAVVPCPYACLLRARVAAGWTPNPVGDLVKPDRLVEHASLGLNYFAEADVEMRAFAEEMVVRYGPVFAAESAARGYGLTSEGLTHRLIDVDPVSGKVAIYLTRRVGGNGDAS